MKRIDAERNNPDVEQIAQRIKRLGLTAPAIFFLEMHRPLRGLSSVVLEGFSPLAGTLFGMERVAKAQHVLALPGFVDELLEHLERDASKTPEE